MAESEAITETSNDKNKNTSEVVTNSISFFSVYPSFFLES